tara:strand:+ start:1104 stop:1307 length:204 start_codon:yes stop_codon:yes gene_type:complete
MSSAIEWVRGMQAEGWVVAYVEVAEPIGAALVEAQLLTAEQVRPERMAGRIFLVTLDAVTFDAVISQ